MASRWNITVGFVSLSALATLLAPEPGVAGASKISGKVTFVGSVPTRTLAVGKDNAICGTSKPSPEVVVGSHDGLANVVLWLEGVSGGKKPKKQKITLDQKGCVYVPHVQAAVKGSKVVLLNSDPVLHNVHGIVRKRDAFNVAMPTKGMKVKKKLKKTGIVAIKCDAGHDWMSAYVHVFKHGYFAVTGENGEFEIDDVPPGTYKLVAWHEKYGTKSQDVSIEGGDVTFSFP